MKIFHITISIITYSALLCILLAHDHYTIDILCAYYVTSRMIYMYHTCVNLKLNLKTKDKYRNDSDQEQIIQEIEEDDLEIEGNLNGMDALASSPGQLDFSERESFSSNSHSTESHNRDSSKKSKIQKNNKSHKNSKIHNARKRHISLNVSNDDGKYGEEFKHQQENLFTFVWWWKLFLWLEKNETHGKIDFECDGLIYKFFKSVSCVKINDSYSRQND